MKIKLGSKQRGLQFGLGSVEIYCDLMECDLTGLDLISTLSPKQPKAIGAIVYAGLLNYAELNDQEIDFDIRKVQHWLDEADEKTFGLIMEEFSKSKMFGRTLAEHFAADMEGGEGKKD